MLRQGPERIPGQTRRRRPGIDAPFLPAQKGQPRPPRAARGDGDWSGTPVPPSMIVCPAPAARPTTPALPQSRPGATPHRSQPDGHVPAGVDRPVSSVASFGLSVRTRSAPRSDPPFVPDVRGKKHEAIQRGTMRDSTLVRCRRAVKPRTRWSCRAPDAGGHHRRPQREIPRSLQGRGVTAPSRCRAVPGVTHGRQPAVRGL